MAVFFFPWLSDISNQLGTAKLPSVFQMHHHLAENFDPINSSELTSNMRSVICGCKSPLPFTLGCHYVLSQDILLLLVMISIKKPIGNFFYVASLVDLYLSLLFLYLDCFYHILIVLCQMYIF